MNNFKVGRTFVQQAVPSRRFENDLILVCQELEKWRSRMKMALDSDPDEFPPNDWQAIKHSLCFYIILLVCCQVASFVQHANNAVAQYCLFGTAAISGILAPALIIFRGFGAGKKRFWRAFKSLFSKSTDNFPFTQLVSGIREEFAQKVILRPFHTNILVAAEQRIAQYESELKERLNSFIGTPTVIVAFGLVGGGISAWEKFNSQPTSILSNVLFWGSIGVLVLSLFGFRLRISLLEFARCRSFLSLEINRRANLSRWEKSANTERRTMH